MRLFLERRLRRSDRRSLARFGCASVQNRRDHPYFGASRRRSTGASRGVRSFHPSPSATSDGRLRREAPWLYAPFRHTGALRRSSPTRGPWLPRCAELAPRANSRISAFRRICSSENKTPRVLPKIGARRHPRIEHHFLYEISLEMSIFVKKIGVV